MVKKDEQTEEDHSRNEGLALNDLHERFARAFGDLFAADIPFFGGGGPGYFGVRLEKVAADGSEVDLVLTFRSGVRYCCFESACHFPYYSARGWSLLRACMDRHGLSRYPLPVIRKFRGVIESGAVATPSAGGPSYIMEGSESRPSPGCRAWARRRCAAPSPHTARAIARRPTSPCAGGRAARGRIASRRALA
jgi:hypothetical protein